MTAATEMPARAWQHSPRSTAGGASVRYFAGGERRAAAPPARARRLGGELGRAAAGARRALSRARARPARAMRRSAPLPRGAGMTDFAAGRRGRARSRGGRPRSSAGTRSAGSSRSGSRSSAPSSSAACSSPRRQASARGRASRRRPCSRSATVRPGRWVAPLRFRYAERAWYRRALFRPWFVSDAAVALGRRGARAARRHARAHRREGRRAGDGRRRPARATSTRSGAPSSLLWGARDAQLPLDDAFEYARRLRAKLRIVADCGHLVPVERPEAWLDALEDLGRSQECGPASSRCGPKAAGEPAFPRALSGCPDSNWGPLRPERSALPGCATPRAGTGYRFPASATA